MRWGSPATGQGGMVPILYCTYRMGDLIVRKTGNSDFSVLSHREGGTGRPCYTGRPRKGQENAPGSLIRPWAMGTAVESITCGGPLGLDDTGSWSLSPGAPWEILLVPALPAACSPIAFSPCCTTAPAITDRQAQRPFSL